MKNSARDIVIHMINTEVGSVSILRPAHKRIWVCRFSSVLLALFSLVLVIQTAGAEEVKPQPVTTESVKQSYPEVGFWAPPVFKPDQPKNWWERSSFEYDPQYPFFLKYITAQLSYLRLSGSSEGTIAGGSVALSLRKGRWSNSLSYSIDQKLVKNETGYISLDRDLQTFEETLKYEWNRHLFVEAGMFWRRISTVNIKDRYVPFLGVGTYNLLAPIINNKKDLLGVELGFAKVYDTYYPWVAELTRSSSDSYTAVYVKADYTHIFNDQFTYRQNLLYKNAVDKTPVYQESADWTRATVQYYNLRYDWRWTNSLEYNYNRFIGAYVSYAIVYDSNPWPTKSKQDTELFVGLRLSYW